MLIRLRPKALLTIRLFGGRLIAVVIFSAILYMLVIAYGNKSTYLFRKHETYARSVTIIIVTPTHKRSGRIGDMLRRHHGFV
ncbi:unnamed protein product [Cylicocyclus nassatus]|uniref:Uncharacterized protein n=1 Tax=Cylicocyclus nassatus TaxID=53992 RepID=A0AA36HDR3_CYLNA|nr:unnamed protein product [Cylicocyclus nassatus]